MTDLIEVKPLPDNQKTIKELQSIAGNLQQKGIRSALRVAAKPVQLAMRVGAPDDQHTPGSRLRDRINILQAKTGVRVRTGAGGRFVDLGADEVGVIVGPNQKKGGIDVGYIAWILEVGAKPHFIPFKRKKAPNDVRPIPINGNVRMGPFWHRGLRPSNWMSNSFESADTKFQQDFYTGLEKWLDKYGR